MDFIDDPDIRDVVWEATHPRSPQSKILAVELKRKFREAARLLGEANATLAEYTDAIRDIWPQEESPEFVQAVKLWYERRGKS